ncbi:glycosyltransferase [Aridibaculum aurantiacum]|uniref:glycosyltransferase n=1 Tax=Aridibaculum aurantiacum TaxID=2810307 RepID=UPI001A959FB1|nr:glycosyltransferase [Aridibaculum aurantiacum]
MGKNVSSISELKLPGEDYVLVLPGWYPTWLDPMPGDFNQRHVKAAGLYTPQVVLYVGKDLTNTLTKTEVRYTQLTDKVVEITVVYPCEKWKAWDIIQSHSTYVKLLYHFADKIKQQWGLPKLLHCYIVIRGGLGGWLLSRPWKRPYILTENWTIYYAADPGFLLKRNIVFRTLVRKIFKNLHHFLPVTHNLEQQVKKLVGEVRSSVIPNVVDTGVFFYEERQEVQAPFQWIHISTMNYQKNPEGLLRAFEAFDAIHKGTVLTMVGPASDDVMKYARSLGLAESSVKFTGNITYEEVSAQLKNADALVLFSRYENLPCVILEALCCGKPVISTRVGGIAEVIDETNGILLDSENEDSLTEAFNYMFSFNKTYDRKKIAETACRSFSYEAVGLQMNEIYKRIAD